MFNKGIRVIRYPTFDFNMVDIFLSTALKNESTIAGGIVSTSSARILLWIYSRYVTFSAFITQRKIRNRTLKELLLNATLASRYE